MRPRIFNTQCLALSTGRLSDLVEQWGGQLGVYLRRLPFLKSMLSTATNIYHALVEWKLYMRIHGISVKFWDRRSCKSLSACENKHMRLCCPPLAHPIRDQLRVTEWFCQV